MLVLAALEIDRPYNLVVLKQKKMKLKEDEYAKWIGLQSQGKGVEYFRKDPVANAFLYDDTMVVDNRFIDCLRLRTNTCAVRTVLARAGGIVDVSCRHCHAPLETMGHVVGQCILHAGRRIARHNRIVKILMKHYQLKGYKMAVEPTIKIGKDTFKPDLILTKGDNRTVVDVTVRMEDTEMCVKAVEEKISKYSVLKEYFNDGKSFSVVPVVIGSRGAIPKSTSTYLKKINMPRFIQRKISFVALKSSVEIVNCHLDY
mgnify:CR=1 FL=1